MTGKLVFLDWITQEMVRAEPHARFVFDLNPPSLEVAAA